MYFLEAHPAGLQKKLKPETDSIEGHAYRGAGPQWCDKYLYGLDMQGKQSSS